MRVVRHRHIHDCRPDWTCLGWPIDVDDDGDDDHRKETGEDIRLLFLIHLVLPFGAQARLIIALPLCGFALGDGEPLRVLRYVGCNAQHRCLD
jgi:hypothetical protein